MDSEPARRGGPARRKRGRPPHPDILTPREWQVLTLIREGLTNEQIAHRLDISPATAKYHVSEILSKLGVATRDQAVAWPPTSPERPRWRLALLWALRRIGPPAAIGGALAMIAALAWLIWRMPGEDTELNVVKPSGRIAFVSEGIIATINPDGSDLKRLSAADGSELFGSRPVWSPDGTRIAFLRHPNERATSIGWISSVRPDGRDLIDHGGWHWSDSLSPCWGGHVISWSPDSQSFLYFTDGEPRGYWIYRVDLQTRRSTRISDNGAGAVWSPNTNHFAYASADLSDPIARQSPYEACAVTVDKLGGGEGRRVATGLAPSWSPDGERLAFYQAEVKRKLVGRDLYVIRADGSRERRLSTNISPGAARWSPDGTRVLAYSFDEGLVTIDVDSTDVTPIATHALYGDWSPDARWIVYAGLPPDASTAAGIYIIPADSQGQATRIADGDDPDWSSR